MSFILLRNIVHVQISIKQFISQYNKALKSQLKGTHTVFKNYNSRYCCFK